MELWSGLLDIVALLTGALVLGVLLERLRQGAIVGYLLAGALLGPGALNVVRNVEAVEALAELGVALLLFTIGLEFSWRRLKTFGPVALAGGTLQIVLSIALTAAICVLIGVHLETAIAIGVIVAPSSTACVLRVLTQRTELDAVHGRASLGVLLLQDIALIPLVLVLASLSGEGSLVNVAEAVVGDVILAVMMIAAFYLVANYLLPGLFDAAALARNRELPILLAIATCLAGSWGAHALHLSPVLGAFVAGVLIAESPYANWVRADVSVFRTLFVTLFFASIGMLADLVWMFDHWHLFAVAVPALIFGKAMVVWIVIRIAGMPLRHAVAAGLCLAQLGEFSFVLANTAAEGGLLPDAALRLLVGATVITLLITPYLVSVAPRFGAWLAALLPERIRGSDQPDEGHPRPLLDGHVIIVGFGPAGRGVLDALHDAGVPAAIVDLNPRAITQARREGVFAIVGDATQEAVLDRLNVDGARAVVLSLPDHRAALQIAMHVRAAAPHVRLFARMRYHAHVADLQEWVEGIVDEELETGTRLGQTVLTSILKRDALAATQPPRTTGAVSEDSS